MHSIYLFVLQLLLLAHTALAIAENATAAAIQFRITVHYPDTFAVAPSAKTLMSAMIADSLGLGISHIADMQMAQIHMNVATAHHESAQTHRRIIKSTVGALYVHFVLMAPDVQAKAHAFAAMVGAPDSFLVNSLHLTGVSVDDGYPPTITLLDVYTPVSPVIANQTLIIVATLDGPRPHSRSTPVFITQEKSSSWTAVQIATLSSVMGIFAIVLGGLCLRVCLMGCSTTKNRAQKSTSGLDKSLLTTQQQQLAQQQQQQRLLVSNGGNEFGRNPYNR